MKIKIKANTETGKLALQQALWIKSHVEEARSMLKKFKERFAFTQGLKQYELVIVDESPFTVEYEVRKVAQLMAGAPEVKKAIAMMMKDYGAQESDYEVEL